MGFEHYMKFKAHQSFHFRNNIHEVLKALEKLKTSTKSTGHDIIPVKLNLKDACDVVAPFLVKGVQY